MSGCLRLWCQPEMRPPMMIPGDVGEVGGHGSAQEQGFASRHVRSGRRRPRRTARGAKSPEARSCTPLSCSTRCMAWALMAVVAVTTSDGLGDEPCPPLGHPSFSPSGHMVAVPVGRPATQMRFVMRHGRSAVTVGLPVATLCMSGPAWSADGEAVAFCGIPSPGEADRPLWGVWVASAPDWRPVAFPGPMRKACLQPVWVNATRTVVCILGAQGVLSVSQGTGWVPLSDRIRCSSAAGVAIDRHARRLVFAGRPSNDDLGQEGIWVMALDGTRLRRLVPNVRPYNMRLAPSGDQIAFCTRSTSDPWCYDISVCSLAPGGVPAVVVRKCGSRYFCWSNDGDKIVSIMDGRAWSHSLKGGEKTCLTRPLGAVDHPVRDPKQDMVLLVVQRTELWTVNLRSGRSALLWRGKSQ